MEIVIPIFLIVVSSIAFSAWKNRKESEELATDEAADAEANRHRKCLPCGYEGEMKTWISGYMAPKFIAVIGFLLGYIPGLIFLGFYWGKYKCPGCGAIGKNERGR